MLHAHLSKMVSVEHFLYLRWTSRFKRDAYSRLLSMYYLLTNPDERTSAHANIFQISLTFIRKI
jgi:hypothetical protein